MLRIDPQLHPKHEREQLLKEARRERWTLGLTILVIAAIVTIYILTGVVH